MNSLNNSIWRKKKEKIVLRYFPTCIVIELNANSLQKEDLQLFFYGLAIDSVSFYKTFDLQNN